jgi:hypothetical protein
LGLQKQVWRVSLWGLRFSPSDPATVAANQRQVMIASFFLLTISVPRFHKSLE